MTTPDDASRGGIEQHWFAYGQESAGSPDPGSGKRRPRRSRRSPAGMAVPIMFAAWLVLEVWLLSLVVQAVGVLLVVMLLLAGLLVGGLVIRGAGLRAWRHLAASLQPGATALPESSGTAMVMLGGALLMVPGFVSDVLGLLCLFPPTRALLRKLSGQLFSARRPRRGPLGGPLGGALGEAYQRMRFDHPDGDVVPGVVIDRDDDSKGGGDHKK